MKVTQQNKSIKKAVLEVIKEKIKEDFTDDYENFLVNVIKNSISYNANWFNIYWDDSYTYEGWLERWFDGWSTLKDEFNDIYYYYEIKEGTFQELYDYNEFEDLFYDDFIKIVNNEIKKINKQVQEDIKYAFYQEIESFMFRKITLYKTYKFYKAKINGRMLSKIIKKTDNITNDDIERFLKEIANKITENVMNNEEYTIYINQKHEITIKIENDNEVEQVVFTVYTYI